MDAYGIFQGGGAKGYAHVGALKAAEDRKIRFRKVAGTSAGAIVAALVAAGYSADEMLSAEKPLGQRGVLDIDPRDVINEEDYARIESKITQFRALQESKKFLAQANPAVIWLRTTFLLLCNWDAVSIILRYFGMTDTQRLENWINGLLRDKIPGASDPVTFGDLGMRLRVVAANLRTGLVHQFGRPGDEALPVAPAVVASACLPFFFRPAIQSHDMFVDGGIVSNLPAWLFDDEREDDPSFLPTFGFRLTDYPLPVAKAATPSTLLEFVWRMLQSSLSGARELEERRIDDYHRIDLRAPISPFSFDTVREKAPELVSEGQACVKEYFRDNIGPQDPLRMTQVLKAALGELGDEYDWRDGRSRASIIIPRGDGHWAHTVYSARMDDDVDDRLRLRTDGFGVGMCIRLKEPVYIKRPFVDFSLDGVNKYEMGARPPDINYLYAIPIFDDAEEWSKENPSTRNAPFAALVIDKGGEAIDSLLLDTDQQDVFANIATIVGEEVRDNRIVREQRLDDAAEPPPTGWEKLDTAGGILVSRRKVRDASDTPLGERLARTIRSANLIRERPTTTAADLAGADIED